MKRTEGRVCPRCGGAPHLTPAKIARGAYTCLACQRAEQRAYGVEHRAEIRERMRRWTAEHQSAVKAHLGTRLAKEKVARAAGKPLRPADPFKQAARMKVKHEIRIGRMKRLPCVVCGGRSEAHHEDYSKPLDVTWLCKLHHAGRHHGLLRDEQIETLFIGKRG